jgi:hypothetical protein
MAPVVEPSVLLVMPWPVFQAVLDGQPLIGGKLYSYVPSTSTPKATYGDPSFITPNTNPVVLDDQGKHLVYLDGHYDLRLFTPDDVLIWTVDDWTFDTGAPPMPGTIIQGSTEATVNAVPGSGVITVAGMVPPGYRCLGVTSTITSSFGLSGGLTTLSIGDSVLLNRWGGSLPTTAGAQTNQLQFQAGDQPIPTVAYAVLISAQGGLFDSSGEIHVTAYWESLAVDTF